METTVPGTSGGESLSLSLNLFSGVVEENIQEEDYVCVCERERERFWGILRDSKGKIAMGRRKTEQNKNKVQSQIENQTKKQCRKLTKLEKLKAYRVFVDCSCCCCGEEEEKDCWRERRWDSEEKNRRTPEEMNKRGGGESFPSQEEQEEGDRNECTAAAGVVVEESGMRTAMASDEQRRRASKCMWFQPMCVPYYYYPNEMGLPFQP
jgi:hypothetical protein